MLNDIGLQMGFDNSNTAGVEYSGGPDHTATGDPAAVSTGIELSIPLSVLGDPTGEIKVTAFINGGGHDYVSNQVTGGVLSGNLGGDGVGNWIGNLADLDFSSIAGDQYVSIVVPEPASLAAMTLGLLCLNTRR